ncbi:carboxypeptidase regulatory-like domain-containing protein [Microbacteriaceae bacterium VKM Ac-2854]|nr:carboxypeptidase regulatory-like domain-containing protein [Microbacteriaceae bacterium VKM Ac-2854]
MIQRTTALVCALLLAALFGAVGSTSAVAATAQGTVRGTVLGEGSGPLDAVDVIAFGPSGYEEARATTNSAGQYELPLDPGSYPLVFQPQNESRWAGQVWGGGVDLDDGTDVVVTPGSTVTADATLIVGSTISGTVTCGGEPIAGVGVAGQNGAVGRTATSADDGSYRIVGASPGETEVYFTGTGDCLGGAWNGVTIGDLPTPLLVTPGEDRGGIDADLELGGSLRGVVTAASGEPTQGNINVYAVTDTAAVGPLVASWPAYSGEDDGYVVHAIPEGDYLVQYQALYGSRDQWYSGAPTSAGADTVHIAPGEATSGIDFAAIPGGRIEGAVGGYYGEHPSFLQITATLVGAPPGEGIRTAVVEPDGGYVITDLATGEYIVNAPSLRDEAFRSLTARAWYDDASSARMAEPVPVVEMETTSGIDFSLLPSASISGTVTAVDEAGRASALTAPVEVTVLEQTDEGWLPVQGELAGASVDQADGGYTVDGLGPGTYRVQFAGYAQDPDEPYYGTAGGDSDIVLGVGEQRTGVDAVIAPVGVVIAPPVTPAPSIPRAVQAALDRLGVEAGDPRIAAACSEVSDKELMRRLARYGVIGSAPALREARAALCG